MYLIAYKSRVTTVGDYGANVNYDISKSRDAIKHLRALNAQTVWVYDKNGYWVSFADRTVNGNPYRPKMLPDGEPRKKYAEAYEKLRHMVDYLDGKSPLL